MIAGIVALAVIILVIIVVVGIYNGLVAARNRYKNAFAQIDVQLKRRHDLIPNLVEVAKKYLSHERETLEAVIRARNEASSARSSAAANPGDPAAMTALMGAEAALGGTMGKLFALAESYPDLKANTNMSQLSEELTSTENKVSFSRQAYNDAVTFYNTMREKFPNIIFAGMFNFGPAQLFEIEDQSEREAVKVSFD
jgi:LemA protein